MNENLVGKKSVFYFPEDCVVYLEDGILKSCEKFEAHFRESKDKNIYFCVLVDDKYWIDKSFKLNEDKDSKAWFDKSNYSSIHSRVSAVYTAMCEGKIKRR